MNKRDYYEILAIDKGASKSEIKKAYRKLAKEFHPDKNKSVDAEAKFKEIQEAYEILSDDQKRSAYDKYGHAGTQGFGGEYSGFGGFEDFNFGGSENINDIFEQFFGSGFGGFSNSSRASTAMRGADIEANLQISFEDAVFGAEKNIQYTRKIICDECKGSGAEGDAFKTCPECKGSGELVQIQQTFIGSIQTRNRCHVCGGDGKIIEKKCKKCHGEGRIEVKETFKIQVPPGIPDGVTIKFKDKGNAGQRGGNFGDLYITIEIQTHEKFERRGDDIYLDKEIDITTAVLGGKVTVPTVHGNVDIKIEPGTPHGKVIKLSGKGGPKFRGRGNGDEYIQIKIHIPIKLSREEKILWEDLKKIRVN